jgi:hypothetical protein
VRQKPGAKCILIGLLAATLTVTCGCRPRRGTAYEGYAFVAAAGSLSLAVVDLTSFSVARQIPLAARPAQILSDPARQAL